MDDPGNSDPLSPNPGLVDSASDGNWCGPLPCHGKFQSNVGCADGHVALMYPAQWFYAGTPWLQPELGR